MSFQSILISDVDSLSQNLKKLKESGEKSIWSFYNFTFTEEALQNLLEICLEKEFIRISIKECNHFSSNEVRRLGEKLSSSKVLKELLFSVDGCTYEDVAFVHSQLKGVSSLRNFRAPSSIQEIESALDLLNNNKNITILSLDSLDSARIKSILHFLSSEIRPVDTIIIENLRANETERIAELTSKALTLLSKLTFKNIEFKRVLSFPMISIQEPSFSLIQAKSKFNFSNNQIEEQQQLDQEIIQKVELIQEELKDMNCFKQQIENKIQDQSYYAIQNNQDDKFTSSLSSFSGFWRVLWKSTLNCITIHRIDIRNQQAAFSFLRLFFSHLHTIEKVSLQLFLFHQISEFSFENIKVPPTLKSLALNMIPSINKTMNLNSFLSPSIQSLQELNIFSLGLVEQSLLDFQNIKSLYLFPYPDQSFIEYLCYLSNSTKLKILKLRAIEICKKIKYFTNLSSLNQPLKIPSFIFNMEEMQVKNINIAKDFSSTIFKYFKSNPLTYFTIILENSSNILSNYICLELTAFPCKISFSNQTINDLSIKNLTSKELSFLQAAAFYKQIAPLLEFSPIQSFLDFYF